MSVKPGSAWWILGTGAMSTHGEEPEYPDAGPVVGLMLTPSGTSVAISWTPPNPLPGVVPAVGYVVKLDDTGETRETTETNYIWDGLQIDTDYCFSVYSKTELGVLSEPVSDCVLTLKEVGVDDAAQVTHIGTSTFAISNPTRGIFEYYLSRSNTDFSQASLISNPSSFNVARSGSPYYVLTTYPGVTEISLMGKTSFVCTSITQSSYQVEVCTTSGGSCSPMCSGSGSPCGNCCCWGCGPVVSNGLCCCPGNTTCNWETRWRKNGVPAGYTERYGEWVKIDNPVVRGIKFVDVEGVVPFSSIGTWEEDYYISFETPEKTYAQVEPNQFEDGTPNENPAMDWVFNYTIMLTFFDEAGDIYLSLNSTDEPEYFEYVTESGTQFVDVRNIQGIQHGSWEAVWVAPADDPHSTEDINVLKELSGSV